MLHDNNAVTAVAEATAKLGRHTFPVILTDSVEQFLAAVAEETGYTFEVDSPDLEGAIAKLGPIARIVGASCAIPPTPRCSRPGTRPTLFRRRRRP
jgi:hypothetical protein